MNILFNNEIINFNKEDFPMLFSGKALVHSGASMFSVSLMTKLFERGEKIVFFTAFSQAKELFREQLNNKINENIIIIESGDEDTFIEELDKIKDLDERIVLFKNIENYSHKIFDKLKDHKLTIFSGDLDTCRVADELMKKEFKTKIFFSQSENYPQEGMDNLPKYYGKITNEKYNGMVSLEIL